MSATFTDIYSGKTVTARTRAHLMSHPDFAHLLPDTDGNPCVWENHYTCQSCSSEQVDWTEVWSCQCDSECPECGADHSPHDSVFLAGTGMTENSQVYDLWASLPEAGLLPVRDDQSLRAALQKRREVATILAALRMWQDNPYGISRVESDIATDGGTLAPLTNDEIDDLCERISAT